MCTIIKGKEKVAEIRAAGKVCGYPKCCIEEFTRLLGRGIYPATLMFKDDYFKGNNTGFVPCAKCREMLSEFNLDLEDLITKRKIKAEFPATDREVFESKVYKKRYKKEMKKLGG